MGRGQVQHFMFPRNSLETEQAICSTWLYRQVQCTIPFLNLPSKVKMKYSIIKDVVLPCFSTLDVVEA